VPKSAYAAQSTDTDLVSLEVTGDVHADMESQSSIVAGPLPITTREENSQPSSKTASAVSKTGLTIGRPRQWKGTARKLNLSGELILTNLRTNGRCRGHVRSYVGAGDQEDHSAAPGRYVHAAYQITNRMEPETSPAKLWSFDHADCKGGPLHEYFPAAGFRTQDGLTVGLLTDAGFRNQWSRIIRRDGTPVKPAPTSIPDLNLYFLPKAADRAVQGSFIQQTFERPLSK